jgi:hypothetical protein
MYIVTGKITKQNTEDSFYIISDPQVSSDVKLHWAQEYKETGKCVGVSVDYSEDQLELTTTQIWADQQSYNDYKNDTILINGLFSVREAYWSTHGITGVIVSEEES